MKKHSVIIVVLLLIFTFSNYAETYNAILISWDGAQREHINELLAVKKLPVIQMLKDTGALVDITVEGHPTETAPGHAQMLTGLPSEVTHIFSNSNYTEIPSGYTIGERLETGLGPDNIVTIMVMGKEKYMGAKEGQPYANAKKNIDVWDGDAVRMSDKVGALGVAYLDKYSEKRFFMFLHFSDPDVNGHAHGENSEQYENALIKCDDWIGKIVDELKKLKIYDKTLVYVTADHGFDEGKMTHFNAPFIILATNDKSVKKPGTQADITPTILKQFNPDLLRLEPVVQGNPLN